MNIVDVQPRDVYVLAEFSVKELVLLKVIMDNMTLNYDSTVLIHKEAEEYLNTKFYPKVKEFIEANGPPNS